MDPKTGRSGRSVSWKHDWKKAMATESADLNMTAERSYETMLVDEGVRRPSSGGAHHQAAVQACKRRRSMFWDGWWLTDCWLIDCWLGADCWSSGQFGSSIHHGGITVPCWDARWLIGWWLIEGCWLKVEGAVASSVVASTTGGLLFLTEMLDGWLADCWLLIADWRLKEQWPVR